MSNRIINIVAFGVLTLLWLVFAAALLFNRGLLDAVWQSFRGLPLLVQFFVGILVLPVFAGLWIWETSWPMWLRLILVLGLAWVTIYTFFPRKTGDQPQVSPAKS